LISPHPHLKMNGDRLRKESTTKMLRCSGACRTFEIITTNAIPQFT